MWELDVIAVQLPFLDHTKARVQVRIKGQATGIIELVLDDYYRLDTDDARHELPALVGAAVESELRAWIDSVT